MLKEQKYLKKAGTILFIVIMNMFAPLSLGMYLPAVPTMADYFHTTKVLVNFSLVGFFFFFAIGIILSGPLSDKHGRKTSLTVGGILYVGASLACAESVSIYMLIISRILQALGAGAMVAISTALVKDCFDGSIRQKVLAIVQGMSVLAPMLAPLAGALILKYFSWRATFRVLVGIGVLCLILTAALQETLPPEERTDGDLGQSLKRLAAVGKNRSFRYLLLVAALAAAPYLAYISVCSYIYIDYFGVSQQVYSYYFAFNSGFAVLGPCLYIFGTKRVRDRTLLTFLILLAEFAGVSMFFAGRISPLVFMLTFLPFTLAEAAIRPLSTNILLDQQKGDTGSASSLINFTQTVFGSIGMFLGGLPWPNFNRGLSIIILSFASASMIGWILLQRSKWCPEELRR